MLYPVGFTKPALKLYISCLDGMDGIVSLNPSPSHKSKSNNSSPAHKKGIFD